MKVRLTLRKFYIQVGGYSGNTNANYNGTEVVMKSGHEIILVNMNYVSQAVGVLSLSG